jgi:hypothetical protein
MIPALAARRVGPDALLVQRPQSPVAHVAAPPTARARRAKPRCGTRGKRWYLGGAATTRRLCARCQSWVLRNTDPVDPTPDELAGACATAMTEAQLDAVIHDIVMTGQSTRTAVLQRIHDGQKVAPLHTHVHAARVRIIGAAEFNRRSRL